MEEEELSLSGASGFWADMGWERYALRFPTRINDKKVYLHHETLSPSPSLWSDDSDDERCFLYIFNVSSYKIEGSNLFLTLTGVLKENAFEVWNFHKGQHQTPKPFQWV